MNDCMKIVWKYFCVNIINNDFRYILCYYQGLVERREGQIVFNKTPFLGYLNQKNIILKLCSMFF